MVLLNFCDVMILLEVLLPDLCDTCELVVTYGLTWMLMAAVGMLFDRLYIYGLCAWNMAQIT
jgi:hypothetical protein